MGTTDCMAKTGLGMNLLEERNPEICLEPLVSVLVPSYNHEKYIIDCLESIKNLNYDRLELIISDDCSQDNTFSLAEQWAEKNGNRFQHIVVARQGKNLGIVNNLQFLFDSAQGEYLAHIASDDVFVPSAIAGRVKMFQENPKIDAIFGNAQLISESGAVIREEFIPKRFARELSSDKLLLSSLILNWSVPGPVMMLRRHAVLDGGSLGPLPGHLWAEDWYIYHRLAIAGKLRYLNEVVAKYRIVQNSMSQSDAQINIRISLLVQIDKMNRHLLTGFNRILLETRIVRSELYLNRGSIITNLPRRMFWQFIADLQRLLLFILSITRR